MDKIKALRQVIEANKRQFFTVDFIKKDGTPRTVNGNIRYVDGHDKENPTSHLDQYVTIVLPQKDKHGNAQFRNVNLETVQRIAIGGKVFTF